MSMMDRFRKAGGYLNNVDATIVEFQLTNTPDFGENAKRPARQEGFTPLWIVLTTRNDGSDKDETTHINLGGGDDFVIGEEGRSLIPSSKDAMLWADTPGARLIASGYANGIPEPDPAPGEPLDFSNFVGYRVRFVQVTDADGMSRMAKKVKANKNKYPKYNELGQRKGTDGKFYDQRNPEISAVYGLSEGVSRPTKAPVTKTASSRTTTTTSPSKGNGKTNGSVKAVEENTDALKAFAAETLVKILGEHDGQVKKVQLNQYVTRGIAKDPRRDDVRKFLFNDENLQAFAEEGITVGDEFYALNFDKSGRDQIISLQS